ncbi:MAG: AAA family ATPase [Ruegeria sp.]
MNEAKPTLFVFCGKPASGKSTHAQKLSQSERTVLIAEDEWLAALFGKEMSSIADFVRCSKKLRDIMGPHIVSMLKAGTSVVLDFQANTVEARAWMSDILQKSGANGQLHYFDLPDDVCKARLRDRNQSGLHPFQLSEDQFDQLSRHFVAPSDEEGFLLVVHRLE